MKLAAKTAYTLNFDPLSPDDLAADPSFRAVGRTRMRRWAAEGQWDDARRVACQAWRQQAEGSLGAAFLRRQSRQMQLLAHLHDEAVRLRCQQSVQPRSWESVASVQLKAADLMRQWSKDHAQAIAQLGTPAANVAAGRRNQEMAAGLDIESVADMNDNDARVAAHAVLKKKMHDRISEKSEMSEDKIVKAQDPVPLRRAAQ